MCGIIGYIGSENAVSIIVEGLKKLEYRGYDSAGVAVYNENRFSVVKQKGRISVLEKRLEEHPLESNIGIGHTRWATHGEPSNENSHPHVGARSKIAIVHNGIIENYMQIRARLELKGISFTSQTDSEVVAQLAEYYAQKYKEDDLLSIIIRVTNALEGSYALGIMCSDFPDTLIAVKKDSPLIIGVSELGNFIASDVPALLQYTNRVYYLEDKEIAVLQKRDVKIYNTDREVVDKKLETVTWSLDSAEKGGYTHFMLKEIMEQPRAISDTISSVINNGENKM
jgi:glucosamine--fructose-6-phosphate aminotransferase (isomerizing)